MANDSNWGEIYLSTWWGDEDWSANSLFNDAAPVGFGFTGILDTVPDAFVGYSLDRISSAYTGGSVRVLRSSDNTEQDVTHNADGTINETDLLAFVGNNLCSNPNEWANGASKNGWTEIGGTVCTFVENVTDADGGTNATRITRTATGSGTLRNTFEGFLQEGEQYTFSVYLRSTNSAQVRLDVSDQIGGPITLDSTWTLYTYTITQDSSPQNFSDFAISSPADGVVEVYNPMVNHGATALPFEDNASAGAGFGYISKIYDQSGNGRTQEQSDNAKQFRIVIGGAVQKENGKVVIRGDGNNDHVSLPAEVTAAHPISFFWAYEHNTEQINNYIIGGQLFGSTGNRILVQDAASQEFVRTTIDGSSRTIFNNGTDIIGEVRTFSSVSKSTGLTVRMDKALWGTASANTNDLGFKSIGINSSNSNMVVWRELIIYAGDNGDQTDNVETIENDIYTRTGRT